jgi:hypothetical protein
LPPLQSVLLQQLVDAMQVVPHSFWPDGQAQAPPAAGQVWPPTQSVLLQQLVDAMQVVPHSFWPDGQAQAPPATAQIWPPLQSVLLQQLVDAMQSVPHSLNPARQPTVQTLVALQNSVVAQSVSAEQVAARQDEVSNRSLK